MDELLDGCHQVFHGQLDRNSTVGMTHPSFWVGILPKGSYKQQVRRVPL